MFVQFLLIIGVSACGAYFIRMLATSVKRRTFSFGARSYLGLFVSSITMLAVIVLVVYSWHYRWRHINFHSKFPDTRTNVFFGIMFDAGSTGSRIHVFKFSKGESDDIYELVEELYEAIQPGLSSYANNPAKAAESLRPLLDKATSYIPADKWTETPIALKATAGLRLLSNDTAVSILNEVENLFKTYRFKLSDNSISLLEGADEGVFCWFTVNFLHGQFGNSSKTMGMLDLGGGSTQITFVAPADKRLDAKSQRHLMEVKLFGRLHNLYTRSYLGLGMNSVRFQAVGGREVTGGIRQGTFHSPCLPDNYHGVWKHGGHEHTLSNSVNASRPRFIACYATVRQVILSHSVERVAGDSNTTFCGLSFYVDRAVDTKLIESPDGGQVTVGDYYRAARKHCDHVTNDDPFRCLDLCYISALLQDGFGFNQTSQLVVRKRINHVELAWPLGAMFDVYGKLSRRALSAV